MVAPIITVPNIAPHLYVHALTAAYRSGTWLYDPDFASLQDVEIWEKLNRDATVRQMISQRCHAVSGRRWIIQPADPDDPQCVKAAEVMDDLVRKVRRFSAGKLLLAKGVFRGSSFSYMQSARINEDISGTGVRNWWTVTQLQDIDRRRIRRVPVRDKQGKLSGVEMQIWSVQDEQWKHLDRNARRALIELVYDDEEERLGYGRGLLESMYFYYYAKSQVLRYGLQGLQRWALGLLIAKVGPEATGSDTRTNDDIAAQMASQLKAHDSANILVMDGRDHVEPHETSGTGHEIVMSLLNYLDDSMRGLALGSVLPSGGGSQVGSLARAAIEQETSEQLMQYDAALLHEALTNHLVGALWDMNLENFQSICPGARMPIMTVVQEKFKDPKIAVEIVKTALEAQIPLVREEVHDAIGFSQPRPGQEIYEPIEPMGFMDNGENNDRSEAN